MRSARAAVVCDSAGPPRRGSSKLSASFDRVIVGTVVTADTIIDHGHVAVRGATIAAIGEGRLPPAAETVDHSGRLILPGLVDGHMHTSSFTGWAGIENAARSAVAGGNDLLRHAPRGACARDRRGDPRRLDRMGERDSPCRHGAPRHNPEYRRPRRYRGTGGSGCVGVQAFHLRVRRRALPAHRSSDHAGRVPRDR